MARTKARIASAVYSQFYHELVIAIKERLEDRDKDLIDTALWDTVSKNENLKKEIFRSKALKATYFFKKLEEVREDHHDIPIDIYAFCDALQFMGYVLPETPNPEKIPYNKRLAVWGEQFLNKHYYKDPNYQLYLDQLLGSNVVKDNPRKQSNNYERRGLAAFNENLLGEYEIYYKIEHKELESALRKDTLHMEKSIAGRISARLFHEVNGEIQAWEGEVHLSEVTHSIFLSLTGPIESKEDISAIFLIISLPPGHIKWQTTTGIISGIKDLYDGLIGLFAVIERQSNTIKHKETDILEFINRYMGASYIEPPPYSDVMKFLPK